MQIVGLDVLGKMSGYTSAETASAIITACIAQDVKSADDDPFKRMGISLYAFTYVLPVLKELKDKKLIRKKIWSNDSTAIYKMTDVTNPDYQDWIASVLKDPMTGSRRLVECSYGYMLQDDTEVDISEK